jgi:hypothetical protein
MDGSQALTCTGSHKVAFVAMRTFARKLASLFLACFPLHRDYELQQWDEHIGQWDGSAGGASLDAEVFPQPGPPRREDIKA